MSSTKDISSSSLPQQEEEQQQFSYHQCTTCGIIYRCEKDICKSTYQLNIVVGEMPIQCKSYDYEKDKEADFNCDEEEPLASGLYTSSITQITFGVR